MKEPYIQVNLILGALILMLFSYSFLYPSLAGRGLTITSSCEGLPEAYCRSRGLSRAFSALLRGNFAEARKLNPYSIFIFSFFAVQLAMRFLFSLLFIQRRKAVFVYIDIGISIVYFIVAFSPMVF